MRQAEPIFIQDAATRLPKQATLVTGVTTAEMIITDSQWKPFLTQAVADALARGIPRYDLPENKHWEWERKARAMGAESIAFGVEANNETQALMIARTDKSSRLPQPSPPTTLLYVDYLGTAPWNLSGLVALPRFFKCGIGLIEVAVRYSVSLGSGGRIGLHSLQGAEGFYRDKIGMRDLGIDTGYEDLRYFEMTDADATAFLRNRSTI